MRNEMRDGEEEEERGSEKEEEKEEVNERRRVIESDRVCVIKRKRKRGRE